MSSAKMNDNTRTLPDGYVAVPVDEAQLAVPIRICAVVRPEAESAGGHLVVLRNTMDARVVLGCLVDAGGAVHQWLELWIQDFSGLAATSVVCREALTNASLDERWSRRAAAVGKLDAAGLIRTGWETDHPRPTLIDAASAKPVHPVDAETRDAWTLCTDDAVLAGRGLPAYSGSLHRYLYLPQLGPDFPFAAADEDSPTTETSRPLSEVLDGRVPFNALGGLMMVRTHSPVGYATYADLLGGADWEGPLHGRSPLVLDEAINAVSRDTAAAGADGLRFLGPQGKAGRMAEALHLKLRLFADAVAQTRSAVAELRRPILSVTADSFQVRVGPVGQGLPLLWTARAVLADPGDAVELKIAGSDERYFLPGSGAGMSIYRSASATGQALRGAAAVRIRQVMDEAAGAVVLEGTFGTQERMEVTGNDLVWIRLQAGAGRVDAYVHLEQESALATGEWRFRSIRQRFDAPTVAALRSAEGVPLSDVMFDVVPQMSSPCDLYSLGVLGVRTLLVNAKTSLPIALDEILSLARQLAEGDDASTPLADRIGEIFAGDSRWAESIGPRRLVAEEIDPAAAFAMIPAELWYQALAALVGMFVGVGADSECSDFADTGGGPLQSVFDRASAELDALLVRTRSLILIDWRHNRQVHAAIRKHLAGAS